MVVNHSRDISTHPTIMTIDLTFPTCWQDLTPKQLRYVFFLLTQNYSADEVKTFCLCRFAGLHIIAHENNTFHVVLDNRSFHLSALQVAEQLSHLDWLDTLPLYPVRLPSIGKNQAISADLTGLPFADFLALDNLYQGFLQTQRTDLLQDMAAILYQAPDIAIKEEERISVFYWFAAVKSLYSRRFSSLFAETNQDNLLSSQPTAQRLQTAMDNQIRALTKGDITKEAEVLATDTIRALTELNAIAKDYQELQKEMKR